MAQDREPNKPPGDWLAGARLETEPQRGSKIRLTPAQAADYRARTEPVAVILKVAEPGYVPPGVAIRAWLGSSLLTADVPADRLDQLESDPLVLAIELSQALPGGT